MATEVVMPQMGFDMKEGKLVRWLKKEGEPVNKGEMIAEIETDKAVVELEAFGSGVLRKTIAREGDTIPVGEVVAIIAGPNEQLPDIKGQGRPAPTDGAKQEARSAAPAKPEAPPTPGKPLSVSPLARRLADERGIDLGKVKGSGPGGRIMKEDVLAFLAQGAPKEAMAPAALAPTAARPAAAAEAPRMEAKVVELTRMRQAIARSMAQSKREIPHFYVTIDVDMTEAQALRAKLNDGAEEAARVSVNDMVLRAATLALLKYPAFNTHFRDDKVHYHSAINMAIAVALPDGLLAPSVLDIGSKTLRQIAEASKQLVERARSGGLRADEMGSGTFSVTNLGMFGVDDFAAIITPPQVCALAVGGVRKAPVVKDGQVTVADRMKLTLSVDHRVVDGAQAAQFLSEVRDMLEHPVRLVS